MTPLVKKKPSMQKKVPLISIAIPVYNEVENISMLYDHLKPVLQKLPFVFELIFVDDGSDDGTYEAIQKLQRQDRRIKAISFSRNFGHQAALTAGLQYAKGDAVITMDGDLQHPPSLIPTLIEKWLKGYQIVFTVRESTADESFFKKLTSKLFYRLMASSSKTPVQPFGADFRLLDRRVVANLNTLEEHDRFLRGLIGWVGFSSIGVPFTADARTAGTSKYGTRKMIKFAFDGLLSFSATPLHLVTFLGLFVSILSFVYGAYSLYAYFFTERTIPGWTSLLVTILFLGGVQLISIGFLGEYLLRVYNETKRRPLYIIKESLNIDTSR
jgi:glycosyltransferase involved in cell wall biosynthesis